jgi:diaminopimelate decarboxylase
MRARMTTDGVRLGGVDPVELARTYGTPLLVLDTDVLDAALARFAAIKVRYGIDVAYAGKALLFGALARRIEAAGLGLDVCSLGELLVAERAGFPAARLTFHGCGKTAPELEAALARRVGRIVVDHREELDALAAAADRTSPLAVVLRVNPGIEAETHRYVRTSGADSKFGFYGSDLTAAVGRVLGAPGLRLTGLHCHLGSNLFAVEPYVAAVEALFETYVAARDAGAPVAEMILGGGFGVDPAPGGECFDPERAVRAAAARVRELAAERGLPVPQLGIEPGRAIVAAAGTTLYRVVTVKRHGERRFVIVDGGLADNPRPALYDADHAPVAVGRPFAAPLAPATLCGRSCESDEMAETALPADLRAGDLVAFRTTGAYTYSMSSNYNRFPRPPIVLAGAARHAIAVRREPDDAQRVFEVDDAR